MWIGHRKEIRISLERNLFRISLRWPIHIINPVDETKLSCYTSHRRSTTVSLETYPSMEFLSLTNTVHVRNHQEMLVAVTQIKGGDPVIWQREAMPPD